MGHHWLGRMLYLTTTRHGVYKYRRTIPPELRGAAGRREWNKSLKTRDRLEAQKRYAAVHLEFEQYLSALASYIESSNDETPSAGPEVYVKEYLRRHGMSYKPLAELRADHQRHGGRSGPSEFEERREFVKDYLGIPIDDIDQREDAIHQSLEAQAVLGTLKLSPTRYRLTDAKNDYFSEKGYDPGNRSRSADNNNRLLVERIIAGLIKTVGEDIAVKDLTRNHAFQYRDNLQKEGKAAGTVKKHLGLARAVLQVAIDNRELNKRNPFHGLLVKDDTPAQARRLPLTFEEIGLLLERRGRMNPELADIFTLLVHTGARLGEVSGLAVGDYDDGSENGTAFIHIRPNNIRSLKTDSSIRQVPLTDEALCTVKLALARVPQPGSADMPLFGSYGRNGGSDAASATLMKQLRSAGITEKRKTIHSIRHSMKDALRAVECPEDIRDAIQGHAQQTVAASYGSGHTLEAKRKWLVKATEKLLSSSEVG